MKTFFDRNINEIGGISLLLVVAALILGGILLATDPPKRSSGNPFLDSMEGRFFFDRTTDLGVVFNRHRAEFIIAEEEAGGREAEALLLIALSEQYWQDSALVLDGPGGFANFEFARDSAPSGRPVLRLRGKIVGSYGQKDRVDLIFLEVEDFQTFKTLPF